MDEFDDHYVDFPDNEPQDTRRFLVPESAPKENNVSSPNRLTLHHPQPEHMIGRQSIAIPSPISRNPNARRERESSQPPPSFGNHTHGFGRPSMLGGPNSLSNHSFSVEGSGAENSSPAGRSRAISELKKKEYWRNCALKKKNLFENRLAKLLAKTLKKLRGLVRLKLNLAG